jgi:hypothetical protein
MHVFAVVGGALLRLVYSKFLPVLVDVIAGSKRKIKVEGSCVQSSRHEDVWGNGGIASHIHNFAINLLIYQSNFTSTKICTHQALISLLHVSACLRYHRQRVF